MATNWSINLLRHTIGLLFYSDHLKSLFPIYRLMTLLVMTAKAK
jgi:hypothetical protein